MMTKGIAGVWHGRRAPAKAIRCASLIVVALGLCACAEPAPPQGGNSEGLRAVNGTELYVKRMGAGEPIVVVHGGPMMEHGYLVSHLAPLAESYELVFYDQRLNGRSAPSVDSTSVRFETMVADIEALRQELDLGRIHVMGHSWGGLLGMVYAARYGQNLRSLMLVSPMAPSSDLWQEEELTMTERITPEDKQERQAIMESEAFANREPEAIRQLLLLSYAATFHDRARAAELEIYVPDDYMQRTTQFNRMQRDLFRYDYQDDLAKVTAPVLILYGEDEPSAYVGGTILRQRLAQAEFVRLSEAGHFPFIEQPEAFLRVVTEFLERAR